VDLSERDLACLSGDEGAAASLAMKLLVAVGEISGAARMIDVRSAHIDSCLYHGQAGLDFAQRLADGGGAVRVPTTLNVSSSICCIPSSTEAIGRPPRRQGD
jgi:predicted aconitase